MNEVYRERKVGKTEKSVDTLLEAARNVRDDEADALPAIAQLKARIAEKENERNEVVYCANGVERVVAELNREAVMRKEDIKMIEYGREQRAAAALLDGGAAEKEFTEREELLNRHQEWLRIFKVAQDQLEWRVATAFAPAKSLDAAILQLEELLQEHRAAEKLRIARLRMQSIPDRDRD